MGQESQHGLDGGWKIRLEDRLRTSPRQLGSTKKGSEGQCDPDGLLGGLGSWEVRPCPVESGLRGSRNSKEKQIGADSSHALAKAQRK